MTHCCPTCHVLFAEPGFCPDHGVALVPLPAGGATLPSDVPAEPPVSTQSRMRAISASSNNAEAVAALRRPRTESEYDLLIGQTLDQRYLITKKLGEGGMGVVFAAKHTVIEKPLAVKVLKREVTRDQATLKRFIQEAKAASRIGHPNIVDVTDFGTTPDGLAYQVMEFVPGVTLAQALATDGAFAEDRAARIAAQIGRALSAAHQKGIVHRDLKPDNIFLVPRDGQDFVKIVDFGIAKVTAVDGQAPDAPRLTRVGAVFGTPEYMSPEQAAGRSDTDHRVDIYALGIILFQMVTGRVPLRGETTVRTLAMQMLEPVPPPSVAVPTRQISATYDAVVLKATAKAVGDRFASMNDLVAELEAKWGPAFVTEASRTRRPSTMQPPFAAGTDAVGVAYREPTPSTSGKPTRTGRDSGGDPAFMRTPHSAPELQAARDLVATDGHVGETDPDLIQPRRRPGLVIGAALAVLAIGGGVLAWRLLANDKPTRVAATVPPADAAPVISVDAAPVISVDAGPAVDAPPAIPVDARRHPPAVFATLEVVTLPRGGAIFIEGKRMGTGRALVKRVLGTRAKVECKLRGYATGEVTLRWDRSTDGDVIACKVGKQGVCDDVLKDVFYNCDLE